MIAVTYSFGDVEIDAARRELRCRGSVRAVQPLVFTLLEYLVRHRERAVPKQELLDRLWPGVVVTDASLQRAISLARTAIDDDGARIRTLRTIGYRFVGDDVSVESHPRIVGLEG